MNGRPPPAPFAYGRVAPLATSRPPRTLLKDEKGNSMEMLRQGMPYGDMSVQGLYFVSCASSPKPFTKMLDSMIFGDEEGTHDKFLDYTTAETGGAFFAPSVTFIKKQAKN